MWGILDKYLGRQINGTYPRTPQILKVPPELVFTSITCSLETIPLGNAT